MFKLSGLKNALQALNRTLEIPRAERHAAGGLGALYGPDSPSWPAGVKNISSTGLYLATEKRLRTGEIVNLVLLEEDEIILEELPPANNALSHDSHAHHPECRISVHARVVREGADGLGLSFVLPAGLDRTLWGVLVRNIVMLHDRTQIEEMFRILRTILFECRLCQSEAEEAILLLGGQLTQERVETLVNIAIAAEDRLAADPAFERMRANHKLLAQILREGSWTQEALLRNLWTGLLVSSCTVDTADDTNQIFAELLGHVGPELGRVFVHGCTHFLGTAPTLSESSPDESSPPGRVILSLDEMKRVSDRADLNRCGHVMAQLFHLGLLDKPMKITSYTTVDSYDVTPSPLGLELYRHCQGERGPLPQDLLDHANECLTTFFAEPRVAVTDTNMNPAWMSYS